MRYYSSILGRFINKDPLGYLFGMSPLSRLIGTNANIVFLRRARPQSGNPYEYCAGNPENLVDPFGLGFWGNLWGGLKSGAKQVFSVETLKTIGKVVVIAAVVAVAAAPFVGVTAAVVGVVTVMKVIGAVAAAGTLGRGIGTAVYAGISGDEEAAYRGGQDIAVGGIGILAVVAPLFLPPIRTAIPVPSIKFPVMQVVGGGQVIAAPVIEVAEVTLELNPAIETLGYLTAYSVAANPPDGNSCKDSGRKTNVSKAESPKWKNFKPYRKDVRTNGKGGSSREYYKWDHTHNDIEVFDSRGVHKGSMDPVTGEMYKPLVQGRNIKQEIN